MANRALSVFVLLSVGIAGSAEPFSDAVDTAMENGLAELQVPGAAVAIVQDGQPLLIRGYGHAELGGAPVDGQTTGFRVASITKLFTATAVMQLVEAGRVDLHADMDRYLDAPVPRSFPQPITLHHLLTHTAGYDQTDIGDAARRVENLIPLSQITHRWPVAQTTPPGYAYRYSNYGFTLGGLVIEQVSGRPYAQYMQMEILQPLGMAHSTFEQPPPPRLREHLAASYHLEGDELVPLPLDYSQVAPADVLITSAGDMAAFMLAHLSAGGVLLEPETTARMQAQQYTGNPSPYGMAYGFQEQMFRGMRVLEHHGGQLGFAAWVFLIPEMNLGVFIAQNRRESGLRGRLRDVVLEAVAPGFEYPDNGLKPDPADKDDLERFAGRYRDAAWTRSTFEKSAWWLGLIGSASTVKVADDGALLVDGQRFVQTGSLEFTHEKYAVWTKGFRTDDAGRVTHQSSGRVTMEKIPWYLHRHPIQLSLAVMIGLGLWLGLAWPLIRRWRGTGMTRAGWVLVVGSWMWILAIVLFAGVLHWASDQPVQLDYGPTWWIVGVLTLTSAATATPPFITAAAWQGWRASAWSGSQGLAVWLFALVAWIAAAYLFVLNLVGYRLGY